MIGKLLLTKRRSERCEEKKKISILYLLAREEDKMYTSGRLP
jgi:hypothetical protein